MTIQELYDFLNEFIERHPKCKDQKIMVKKLDDDFTWEEVTIVTNTVVKSCPQYGSPLYFHSQSEEAVAKTRIERMKDLDDDDEYYV
ncbi:MAG: hypothetical protein IJW24_02335 [Clostridia bacterium]|nr:hypothetical protein [Clostridia bacterium]